MAVKPFNWGSLKKVSGDEARLLDTLFELIPATYARDKIVIDIRKMLMKNLGEKSFFYIDAVETGQYAAFLSSLPEAPVISVVDVETLGGKIVVYIDRVLAFLLIDKLLGCVGDVAP